MKISMLGSGYVGLVAGVCFADAGHGVSCVDSEPEKITALKEGRLPFFEPGLNDLFQRNRKRMSFHSHISEAVHDADVVFIAVGTPERDDGGADMEPTFNALKEICESAKSDKIIVLKSTVPIGTAKKAQAFCREHSKFKLEIVNNPEFLKQGGAVDDFLHPDRVVVGCSSSHAQNVMLEIYRPFLKNESAFLVMDNTSAEMTKYAANSFLALKISFINELALLADRLGANIEDVKRGFTSDHRINPAFFQAGIGYGGSCFPKDVRALRFSAQEVDLDLKLLKAADDANERQKTVLTDRLKERLGDLSGKKIALWGLSFKPDTDDVRRAPSLRIIEELTKSGAEVSAYDPVAVENAKKACKTPFHVAATPLEAARGADAILLLTEWNEFKAVSLKTLKPLMRQAIIFDGRNAFEPERLRSEGFEYFGIGRQFSPKLTT